MLALRRDPRLPSALTVAALLFSGAGPSGAYRLLPPDDRQVLPARAADAVRWDPAVWGPGSSLTFVVSDSPGWSARFETPDEALPFVERALAAWSDIPTADIRWRVEGVEAGPGLALDGRNTISVKDDPPASAALAAVWEKPGAATRSLVECDVVLPQRPVVEDLDGLGLSVLLHELGHCVGLAHAAIHPGYWTSLEEDTGSAVWRQDPKMSYGRYLDHRLTVDDMVGASLLRPAPGWEETTGSVAGSVALPDGKPARLAHILAVHETTRATVGGFVDQNGRFRIEGLDPGTYALWVSSLILLSAHGRLLTGPPLAEVGDRFVARPVRVRAGREAGGLVLGVAPGRRP